MLPADLADHDAVAEAAATAAKELGPVDILVNNAAVVEPAGPTVSTAPAGVVVGVRRQRRRADPVSPWRSCPRCWSGVGAGS